MVLPVNVDVSYPDRTPGDSAHQRHHDEIHTAVNALPAQLAEIETQLAGAATLDNVAAIAAAAVGNSVVVAMSSHVLSPNPHPAYDDTPDLTLLFQNGLI